MKTGSKFIRFIKRFFLVIGIIIGSIVTLFLIYFIITFVSMYKDVLSAKEKREDSLGIVEEEEEQQSDDLPKDPEEIREKYLSYFTPADDDLDFKWANDYTESPVLNFKYARDSKAYESIFGYAKPTLDDLYTAIDRNPNLSDKYREFLKEFCSDWLKLYPESDLSVFYHNLETMKISELTDREIILKTMSAGAIACYIPKDNEICINAEANIFDRSTNDYVVMVHELQHAARGTKTKIEDNDITVKFSETLDLGLYEEEALVTYFALQLQGMDRKAIYYSLQSSYYRQLMPLVDYDGSDFMNHSVNYFVEKVQEAFDKYGIETEALYYLNLMDSQALQHYKSYSTIDYTDFSELYETQVTIYGIQHLKAGMTHEEYDRAFEVFWEDITYNFENLPDPYPTMIKEDYRPYWDEYVKLINLE